MRVLALIVTCLAAATAVGQSRGPDRIRQRAGDLRREGTLRPGDPAPDFDLPRLGAASRVRLSAFKDKTPVALVFGSYT